MHHKKETEQHGGHGKGRQGSIYSTNEPQPRHIVSASPRLWNDPDPPIDDVSVQPQTATSEDRVEERQLLGLPNASNDHGRAAEHPVLDRTRIPPPPQTDPSADSEVSALIDATPLNAEECRRAFAQGFAQYTESLSTPTETDPDHDIQSLSLGSENPRSRSRFRSLESRLDALELKHEEVLEAIENLHLSISEGFDDVNDGLQRIQVMLTSIESSFDDKLARRRDG
ncbi:hypothetical protein MMC07_005369 [Pseudocyphellaria aurata]|nr:hypothetical protein [Pseudocyphellaria aurata]